MKVKIVCVGNLKEKYLLDAANEYIKRLSRFVTLDITEIKEEKLPANFSDADVQKVIEKESEKIFATLEGYVFVCDLKGKQLTSNDFAAGLKKLENNFSTITFVIGGSNGVNYKIKERADMLLKFSDFTFPHQLFRVMLLEQIYRAYTINNNVPYHK